MVRITFVDADGETGNVEDDLTLRYAGRHREEMAAAVSEALAQSGSRAPPISLLQRFAIRLYAEFPLTEVELVDNERTE